MKISFSGFTCGERLLIKRIYKKAAATLKQPSKLSVSLACVDQQEIRRLNNEFRKTDKPTDVLSFPSLEIKAGEAVPDNAFIGDIAVCRSVTESQAKEYEHSVKRELAFLALHGFLHLLGFDHETEQQEQAMQQTAEAILSSCGIER